jgi:ParB family chromosome partitioning protein
VQRLAKLKKAQIASEAERLAVGSGWLPHMLAEPVQTSEALNEQEPEGHQAA